MNEKDIENLANLARLELSDTEKTHLAGEIQNILKFIDQIREADLSRLGGASRAEAGVEVAAATRTPLSGVYNVLRDDANPHEGGIHTETLVAAAPEREGDYVKVKKIL